MSSPTETAGIGIGTAPPVCRDLCRLATLGTSACATFWLIHFPRVRSDKRDGLRRSETRLIANKQRVQGDPRGPGGPPHNDVCSTLPATVRLSSLMNLGKLGQALSVKEIF